MAFNIDIGKLPLLWIEYYFCLFRGLIDKLDLGDYSYERVVLNTPTD